MIRVGLEHCASSCATDRRPSTHQRLRFLLLRRSKENLLSNITLTFSLYSSKKARSRAGCLGSDIQSESGPY